MTSQAHEKSELEQHITSGKDIVFPYVSWRLRGKFWLLYHPNSRVRSCLARTDRSLLHTAKKIYESSLDLAVSSVDIELYHVDLDAPPKWLQAKCTSMEARDARSAFWTWMRSIFGADAWRVHPLSARELPETIERCSEWTAKTWDDGEVAYPGFTAENDLCHSFCGHCRKGFRWKGGFDPGDQWYLRWRDAYFAASTGKVLKRGDSSVFCESSIEDRSYVDFLARTDVGSLDLVSVQRDDSLPQGKRFSEIVCVFKRFSRAPRAENGVYVELCKLRDDVSSKWKKINLESANAQAVSHRRFAENMDKFNTDSLAMISRMGG